MPALTIRPGATQVDLVIRTGESFEIVLPVVDAAGVAVDLTGWTAKSQIRRAAGEPVLHEWSAAAANITLAGSTVTLAVAAAVTATWTWSDARYDVEITDTAGRPHCIAQGSVRTQQQITQ